MKLVVGLTLGLLVLASCQKEDTKTCVAHSADGSVMYEVTGQDVCEEQTDATRGEYCDCSAE